MKTGLGVLYGFPDEPSSSPTPPPSYTPLVLISRHSPYSPLTTHVFLPSIFVFLTCYHVLAPLYPSSKQRAWILTALSSAFMTTASLPFVWDYVAAGCDVGAFPRGARPALAYVANRVFQAYLVADQIAAARYYRVHVAMLTGWIHHNVYILLVEVAIRRAWASIFCLCTIMELPTFLFALASLRRKEHGLHQGGEDEGGSGDGQRDQGLRRAFTGTFFITRIVFHLVLCVAHLRRGAGTGEREWQPGVAMAVVWPLHAYWFWGGVKGPLWAGVARVFAWASSWGGGEGGRGGDGDGGKSEKVVESFR